jgi:hypothetical protein
MAGTMAFNKDPSTANGHSDGPPVRKKIKTSDLPIPSTTRASIEDLAHKFKKKGGYDSLRKEIWEDLEKSVSSTAVGCHQPAI